MEYWFGHENIILSWDKEERERNTQREKKKKQLPNIAMINILDVFICIKKYKKLNVLILQIMLNR